MTSRPPTAPTSPQRYLALDGFRGVAAILVMLFHFTTFNHIQVLARSWIMVDAFFLLSGFVLQHVYADRISRGQGFARFFGARLHRLYPLYLAGLLIGIIGAVVRITPDLVPTLAQGSVSGALLLPWLSTESYAAAPPHATHSLFPLNDPAWSLFFELLVNVAFFFWIARLQGRYLSGILLVALLALLPLAYMNHTLNGGWDFKSFALGFPRVTYHFFAGVLIHRVHRRVGPRLRPYALPLSLTFLAVSAVPLPGITAVAVFILAPLMVTALSAVRPGARAGRACAALGELSYPLYIAHVPVYALIDALLPESAISTGWRIAIASTGAIVCSALLAKADHAWRTRKALPRAPAHAEAVSPRV